MRGTLMNRNSVASELRSNYLSLSRHNGVHTGRDIPDRNVDASPGPIAIQGSYGRAGKLKDSLPYRLARDCAGMNAHAAAHDGPVDHGDALAYLRGRDCTPLSRRTTADHNKVIFGSTHLCLIASPSVWSASPSSWFYTSGTCRSSC